MARSSGGSYGGGGSSSRGSGGSSGRSSSSYSSSHRSSGPRVRSSVHVSIGGGHHHHGHGGYSTSSAWPIWFMIAIFIAFFSIPCFFIASECKDGIEIKQNDYVYYADMVNNAKEDSTLVTEGKIIGKYKEPDTDRWFLKYEIYSTTFRNTSYEFETYAVYTEEQISQFKYGDKIQIAVNNSEIDIWTDSMPMDFVTYTIEDDGNYVLLVKQQSTYQTVAIFMLITAGVLCLIGVIHAKKAKNTPKTETETVGSSTDESTTAAPAKKSSYCPYCGCKSDDSRKKCEHCGANLRF